MADAARAAADEPDPWQGLVGLLVRMQELQSQDRGLKEIVLGGARGTERAAAARALLMADHRRDPAARKGRRRGPPATSRSPISR